MLNISFITYNVVGAIDLDFRPRCLYFYNSKTLINISTVKTFWIIFKCTNWSYRTSVCIQSLRQGIIFLLSLPSIPFIKWWNKDIFVIIVYSKYSLTFNSHWLLYISIYTYPIKVMNNIEDYMRSSIVCAKAHTSQERGFNLSNTQKNIEQVQWFVSQI